MNRIQDCVVDVSSSLSVFGVAVDITRHEMVGFQQFQGELERNFLIRHAKHLLSAFSIADKENENNAEQAEGKDTP